MTHMAATLGAGVQDGELYAAMAEHDAISVGGENNDVGVIGWATGGGHGLATGVYGMGADNVIEAVMVTANGDILTANACQNEDIFWAIRGGGGGTFGVITSVTVNAYKMPSFAMTGIDISAKNGTNAKDWYRLLARLHGDFSRLQNAALHGYYTMAGAPMAFSLSLFEYNTANDTSETILKPLLEILEAANAIATFKVSRIWKPSWYDFVKTVPLFGSTGKMHGTKASRFIPEPAVRDPEMLARVLEAITAPSPDLPGVTNPSISGTMTGSKKPVDNALNPAWREAIVHVITGQSWDDTLSDDLAAKAVYDMTYKRGYALRQLAPDTGAYVNEANPNEPDWQWSFWGPNYPRLQAIKQKYDPDGLFWCLHCVGSEAWTEMKNGTLCPII
ncbi:FAD binding domain protein [Aspergillus sclerotialis]|uniref:FAD binding domain protein n=1 Tax=Aspergillus sclerotialis TaxID=2070753 RepID=A0A3A2ZMX4_9EURO|nr:FAD binding domain protein [Aspergillus sclerotialis]